MSSEMEKFGNSCFERFNCICGDLRPNFFFFSVTGFGKVGRQMLQPTLLPDSSASHPAVWEAQISVTRNFR